MPRGAFDRSARRGETRARLLGAAAEVYAREGFGGATLDEVAAAAGFTKGAVYDHFGSKENLLVALLEEHLSLELAEQMSLFDRSQVTTGRPLAGSASWMERIDEDPDPFRLFVELWVYAQRDERLRGRLANGLGLLRETFAGFAAASAADAGVAPAPEAEVQFANVTLGLAIGLPLIRLIDERTAPRPLLGAALSVLIGALEASPEARELLAGAGELAAAEGDRD